GRDRQQRLDPRPRRVSQLTTPHTHNPDITGHMPRTFAGQGLGAPGGARPARSRGGPGDAGDPAPGAPVTTGARRPRSTAGAASGRATPRPPRPATRPPPP